MSVVADQTLVVDAAELREILVDVGALRQYLADSLGDQNTMEGGPIDRAGAICYRLKLMLGLDEPTSAVLSRERELELDRSDDELYDAETMRSKAWQSEDDGAVYKLIGARIARAIEATS